MLDKLNRLFAVENRLTRRLAGVVTILLVIVALNNLWGLFGRWGWVAPEPQDPRTITVSGEGKIAVTSDTARLNISVVTDGRAADEVQRRNTETMNRVIDYVKSQGVEAKDIKTTFYNLYPRYDYVDGRQIPAGFSLTQGVEVKVRDLKKVGEMTTGVVARGANQVQGVEFFVDNPDAPRAEARREAFEKARAKAKEMAKLAKVRLGDVVTFSESFSGGPPVIFGKFSELGVGGGGVPDTQPGSQEITVNVNVVFEIR